MTMSPGLVARPLGRFSVAGMMATTLARSLRPAQARSVPNTPAAPHMSYFISSMDLLGLIEMPPLSKVTPLPTSTTGLVLGGPFRYSAMISLGASSLPLATASRAPMLSFSSLLVSRTLTLIRLNSRPSARALSAR